MPTINKRFLLKLVLVVAAFAGVLFGVHAVQAGRIPEALHRQAERAADANKLDVAIHYYRQYLEFAPDDVETQVKLAGLMRQRTPGARGRAEVIFLYDRILRLDPDRHEVRREALAACLKLGRYSDAVIHAEALLKPFPNEAALWQQLGAAQAGLNQLADARTSYERALTIEPGELVGYQRLTQLLWRNLNDPEAARAVLDRMAKALPQSPEGFLGRAKFEILLADEPGAAVRGDLKRAAADLQRVLELDPENADASFALADLYQRERNVPAAHALLRDALALYPKDLRLIRSLSWLELVRGNAPAAIAVLEDGLKAIPDGFDLLVPLADLLVQQGDTTRTAEIVRRLEARKAPPVQVKYLKARLAMRDAKWANATALLENLRAEVTHLPGLEIQLNLLLAVCAGRLGEPAAEEKAYQRVVHTDPKNVQARTGLGNLYLALGRFDEAVRELEAAAQSPYAPGSVVAQWVRTKAQRLRATTAPAAEWQKLDKAVIAAAPRFGAVSSEPLVLRAEVAALGGKANEAVQFLRKEVARRPGDARLWAVLADLTADVSGASAALALVDEAQAAAGDNAEIRLARARLYAREPGRVRPLAALTERMDSWPEAEQLRLLGGMVEVFDSAGDRAGVIATLKAVSGRRPADKGVWVKLHERATLAGDAKTAAEARAALVKLDGEGGPSVLLCDAGENARTARTDAAALIEQITAAFGPSPIRSDACLALAALCRQAGKAADAERLAERAFSLEPTRYDAAKAWLVHLCGTGADDRAQQFVTRLATDPRWAGDSFRRVVADAVPGVPAPAAAKLLGWARPFAERDPGGLGWLAETAAAHKVFDPNPILDEAVTKPGATADDWLRLAIARGPDAMKAARTKLPPRVYLAAAAVLQETPAGKDFAPELADAAERRLLTQNRLSVQLSRNDPAAGTKVLSEFLKGTDVPKADDAWARRNLAMLYAVGGTPEDRKRAMELVRAVDEAGTSPDDLRATAGVLTTLSRYLEGADRVTVLTRAAAALDAAYKAGKSPKDLFTLSQLYRSAGNRGESRKCLQLLLNSDPGNIYYLVAALEELVEDRNHEAAATFAKKVIEAHPGEFRAVAAVARFECHAGRPGAALELAERYARNADPAAGDHLTRSGRVAELLDELARFPNVRGTPAARAMTDAAVERFAALVPNRPEAVVGVVGALAADGRAADGFARLERFGKAVPARVRATAGLAAVRGGGITEAQAETVRGWIEGCIAEEPGSPVLLMNRAEFLSLRQDLAGAAAEYEKILQADPRNVVALNNLAWVLAADPLTAERALDLVAKATREVGLTGDLLDTRARVRITLKQFEEAESDLTDAIRLEPTGLRWFHLAVSRLGQTPAKSKDAADAFREARRRGLDSRGVHPADRPTYQLLEGSNRAGG